MSPSIVDIAAAEAAARAQVQSAPRVDPNFAHRPPAQPPILACSKDEADARVAAVLAQLNY